LNQQNKELYEKRNLKRPEKKIKHLKIGIIIAICIGIVFLASEAFGEITNNLIACQRQQNYMDYENDLIDYDEYRDKRNELDLREYENELFVSIFSNTAMICLIFSFVFIIANILSISFDGSFDRKFRRLSLIIAFVVLLFIMYLIFYMSSPTEFYLIF